MVRSACEGPAASPALEPTCRLTQALTTHFPGVWRLGRRLGLPSAIAEEVAQEAFLVLAKRLETVEAGLERASLHTRRLLVYIIALAAREDRDAHSSAEAPPVPLSS